MSLTKQQLREAFEKLDKDKTGSIELDEILELSKAVNMELTTDEIFDIFNNSDKDDDMAVSYEEFEKWYFSTTTNGQEKKGGDNSLSLQEIRKAFDKIDSDGSGALELDEILQLSKELGENVTKTELFDIFKEIDKNDDRKISFEEFLSWYRFGKDIPIAKAMKAHMSIMAGLKFAKSQLEKFDDENLEGDGSETQEKLSQIDFRYKPAGGHPELKQGKSVAKFEVQSGKKNTLTNVLKHAFMNYNEENPYLFFSIKAKTDGKKLLKAVDKFLTNMMLFIELMSKDSYDKHLTQLNYKLTQINNRVIIIFDLGNDMTRDFKENFDYMFKIFSHVKPNLLIKFKSYVNLLDVLPKDIFEMQHLELDSNNEVIAPEEEQHKTKFSEPNLFDFIVKGFTITSKLTCSSHVKDNLKSIVSGLLEEYGRPIIRMGIADDADGVAEKILPKNEEDIYKNFEFENLKGKIGDLLKDSEAHFPDGADIVDELGAIFNELGEQLDKMPFIMDFLQDLRENGLFDVEGGIIHRSTKISLSLRSKGVKEIYDKVMEGITEVEFDGW